MSDDLDVLILGGGLAGRALALGLLGQGLPPGRILIADKPTRSPFRVGESATPDVPQALARLGLSDDLAAQGHHPCHGTLSLWAGRRSHKDFLRSGQGHGWHLDRAAFDAMTQTATRNRGIPERQDSIESLAWVQGRWEVAFGDGKRRRPRFLVDAAGRKSPLGTRLGARRHTLDQMVALAVRIPGTPDSRTAMRGQSLVESMRDGWWYAAPLPDGSMVIQLMTDADIARDGALRTPEAFLAAWRQTEGLSDLIPPPATTNALGPIATFPAQTGALNKAAGPGWVAVGDALIGFDPLTSSGIAGAFSDAWAALPVVARWLEEGPGTTAADAAITYGRAAQGTMIRYLRERSRLYSEEHRWPKAPFWARRTQADPVSV